MDQGDAAVWVAGLGIAGTLLGALGGATVQGWFSRRQVRDQEAANIRHWLREQRRIAYAEFLLQLDGAGKAVRAIMLAHVEPDWDATADHSDFEDPWNEAHRALRLSVAGVAVTGPAGMHELAQKMFDAFTQAHDSLMCQPDEARMTRQLRAIGAVQEVVAARERFVRTANAVLSGSDE